MSKRITFSDLSKFKPPIKNKNIENATTNIKSFHYLEDGSIDFSIMETKYSTKKLESKVYELNIKIVNQEPVPNLKLSVDNELFNSDLGFYYEDKIKNIYDKFFLKEIKNKVNKLGYNHKFGILLYGKQGTGKTSMFKKYFNHAVENHNAIVFNITTTDYVKIWWNFIKDIRKIQKNPIVVFIDEFEGFLEPNNNYEREFKTLLDGSDSIDNCLFMLTTNYIDKVPKTIKDRPSRIKYAIEVHGIQDEVLIEKFLTDSFKKIDVQIDFKKDISKMKGYTIDQLKQFVLDKVMDLQPEDVNKNKLGF
jgi:SpoVK/Ycf46/Vps4 family AAA+-type ATPase